MFTRLMLTFNSYVATLNREEGQGLAEYALIIVLVSIAVVAALGTVGDDILAVFESISTSLTGAGS
jgi:pilus assembly protein Flp/PilA